jgi:hypothetical protein
VTRTWFASSRASFISNVSSVRKICAAREGDEQQLRSPFFRFPSKPPFFVLVCLLHRGGFATDGQHVCVVPERSENIKTTIQL